MRHPVVQPDHPAVLPERRPISRSQLHLLRHARLRSQAQSLLQRCPPYKVVAVRLLRQAKLRQQVVLLLQQEGLLTRNWRLLL